MAIDRVLSDEERLSWLQLSLSENIGPVTFRELITRLGTATDAIKALPELAKRGGRQMSPKICSRQTAELHIANATAAGATFVVAGERGYPPYLRHIHGSPPLLCVAGNLDLAATDSVAIVGARNASALGMKFTRMVAERLAGAGLLVVSGLARGIDTAAHQASFQHGTAAVVAGGVDHFYPPENEKLQRDIAARGLLISEMVPGTAPKAEHFPRRNRIISGMSRAVVVVEAAMRSGSLITARFAAEQGRDVFAVPGSPLDPRCQGTNRLIRDGATILTSADDVLESLQSAGLPRGELFLEREVESINTLSEPNGDDRDHLVSFLSPTETPIDDLIRESGLGAEIVAAILLELEVAGRVIRQPGGLVALLA
jgi:DNA processing protein